MKLVTVESSNISQIGFEEDKVITLNQRPINILRVVFNNGLIYDYYNVEKDIFERFLDSNSKGKYLHEFIINKYQYEKIG